MLVAGSFTGASNASSVCQETASTAWCEKKRADPSTVSAIQPRRPSNEGFPELVGYLVCDPMDTNANMIAAQNR
jgi:hypothetical protein